MSSNIFLQQLDQPKAEATERPTNNIFLNQLGPEPVEEKFVPEDRPDLVGKFSQQKPSDKTFGHRGKVLGGKLGRATEAAIEKPGLILGKVPQALEQFALGISEDPLKSFMRSISPAAEQEPRSVGRSVSEFIHGKVPERLKEGAQDIADIEEFLIPFGRVPKVSTVRKPSGMPSRIFEKFKKEVKVSPQRHEKITEKLEGDFRKISDKLFEKHPAFSEMKNNPAYRQELVEGMEKVSELASEVPGKVTPKHLEAFLNRRLRTWARETKGLTLSDSEKAFADEFTKHIQDVKGVKEPFSFKDMVDQFRKNSRSLGEYFDPSKPKSLNTGKRDALLEYNRGIQELFETVYPDSEFSKFFRAENKRWSDLASFETAEAQIDKIFAGNKINFKEAEKILDPNNANLRRNFSQLMGKEGFKDFEALLNDLNSVKNSYGLLKKADQGGFKTLVKLASSYIVHPSLAKGKLIWDLGKNSLKALLDKPQLAVEWKTALDLFKSGKFSEAEKAFESLDQQMKASAEKAKVMATKGKLLPEEVASPLDKSRATIPEKKLSKKPEEKPINKKSKNPPEPKGSQQRGSEKPITPKVNKQEIKQKEIKKRKENLLNRLSKSEERQKRIEKAPKTTNNERLANDNKKLIDNTKKLIDQLDEEGDKLVKLPKDSPNRKLSNQEYIPHSKISEEEKNTIFKNYPEEAFRDLEKHGGWGGRRKDGVYDQLLPYDVERIRKEYYK